MEKQENLHLIDEIITKIKNDSRIVNENDLQNMETIELSYSGDLIPVDFLLDYFNEIIDKQQQNDINNEIKFLEKHLKFIRKARKNVAGLQVYQYPIQERIEKLEKKLKEVK